MHSGNGEHDKMDRRAIACFDQALADAGLADNGALQQVLHDLFFAKTLADCGINNIAAIVSTSVLL